MVAGCSVTSALLTAQTVSTVQVRAKFTGVLNGIDSVEWDPASDPLLPANFSPARPAGKALCKQYLQVKPVSSLIVTGKLEPHASQATPACIATRNVAMLGLQLHDSEFWQH